MQPTGREKRDVTGANRRALSTRQARGTENRDGETIADGAEGDPGGMEGVEVEKDVTMSETTPEIEMGAAAFDD